MTAYRLILVVVNPSLQRTPAVLRAAEIAHASGAALHMLAFDDPPGIDAALFVPGEVAAIARKTYEAERARDLNEIARIPRELGIKVDTQIVRGRQTDRQLASAVAALSPDLVIRDVHREQAIRRVILGSRDWAFIAVCPSPLLLVHDVPIHKPRRVLAAIDPVHDRNTKGRLNERIVETAVGLAIQCDAEVHLIHVFEGLSGRAAHAAAYSHIAFEQAHRDLSTQRRHALDTFASRFSVPEECKYFLDGDPVAEISRFVASHAIDVVVAGYGSRGPIESLAMGSVAERLLQAVDSDVLIVHPAAASE
ncbi:MAG: universal stress protein [Sinimarinibacterium sp.]|jgi:universal stress protein E